MLDEMRLVVSLCDWQLARHSKVLQQSLKPGSGSGLDPDGEKDDALQFYAKHTAQIEVHVAFTLSSQSLHLLFTNDLNLIGQIVRYDRTMEQIVFPVPNICEYLTEESKGRVFHTTERDDQGSKVNDFFQQFDNLYNEMRWQKKIRSESQPPAGRHGAWSLMLRQQGRRVVHSLARSSVFSVLSVQKIKLSSGSLVTSPCGGASPSTWPVWSISLWPFFTRLEMTEMRVRLLFSL